MSAHIVPTLLSVIVVSLVSLVGALALVFGRLKGHNVLIVLVAFAAGTLLGDAFFHLLPEATEAEGGTFSPELGILIVVGFVAFFLLETALRWQHSHGEEAHPHAAEHGTVAPFAWTNLVGDGIHNFVDGVLIGTAYIVSLPVGIATTIAVAAHEVPQELGDFAVLLRAGLKPKVALLYNLGSALVAVLGALVVILAPVGADALQLYAVPLIAGGFIYIAAADLVPELHHHTERRFVPLILVGFVVGLVLMVALLGLE